MPLLEIEPHWIAYTLIVLPIAVVPLCFAGFARRFASQEDIWVGFIGGIALGYLTIYMLPKLASMVNYSRQLWPDAHPLLHSRAYLMLLAGILSYLLIERLDRMTSNRGRATAQGLEYGLHGLYGFLATYVAIELPLTSVTGHFLVGFILVLHMMGMCNLLIHRRAEGFPQFRWLLTLLILSGGSMALLTELPRGVINSTTAFLSGVILINVIAEELPIGHKGRFRWFLAGITVFLLAAVAIGHYYRP